ncbi:ankyrin repeat domain-containing protein [Streptomyces chartreusis]
MSTGDFAAACAAGDSAAVNQALRDGAALGPLDDSGVTPLHLAAAARSAEVVAALLGAGADPRAATAEEAATRRWFANGSDAEFLADSTPLHVAVDSLTIDSIPDPAVVRHLIDAGADLGAVDSDDDTPLGVCFHCLTSDEDLRTAQTECIRLLLTAGANPNIALTSTATPLSLVDGDSESERVLRELLWDAGAMPPQPAGGPGEHVIEQLGRLGGQVPDQFAPIEWVVATPAGKRQVPEWAQRLLAVVFTAGDVRVDDYSDALVSFYGTEIEAGYFRERRAWYGIGQRGDYHWYIADLDEQYTDNPTVHRLDMEGGDYALDDGYRLTQELAGMKVVTPPGEADRFPLACSAGDVTTVAALLRQGASLGPLDDTGITPLHLAVMSRSTELVRLLLDSGADPRAAIAYDTQTPWTYVDADAYSSGDLWQGATALHIALGQMVPRRTAAIREAGEIVHLLLDAGADPDAVDRVGWTPMQLATGDTELVRHMLAAGADPSQTAGLRPPLVQAVCDGNKEAVRLLLAAGADASAGGAQGTPLVAAADRSGDFVRLLLDAGADPDQPNPDHAWEPGLRPVHRARVDNLRLLLAAGADPDARTPEGFTPLVRTMLWTHLGDPVDAATVLVDGGADVNAAVPETAVREHVTKQYKPQPPLADLTATTPLGIARHLGMTRTVAYLTERGAHE